MKRFNKVILSLVLVMALVLGNIGLFNPAVHAEDNMINVKVRVEGTYGTILPEKSDVRVPAGSGSYDVLVAAGLHPEGSNSYIEAINDDWGNFGWLIFSAENGKMVYGPWSEGDSRVFMAVPMNKVVKTIIDETVVSRNQEFTVTVKEVVGKDDNENISIQGAEIGYYYGEEGKDNKTPEMTKIFTDENGQAKIKFNKSGKYHIIAEKKGGRDNEQLEFRANASTIIVE